jgi:Tfp pilus assembly protein PilX
MHNPNPERNVMNTENQEGFALIVVVLIIFLLTVAGISALNLTTTEIQIAGNDRMMKQDFYVAEGGCIEKAIDIDKNSSSYAVVDINTPVLLTTTVHGNALPRKITQGNDKSIDTAVEVSMLDPKNATDALWPAENQGTREEYAYRIYYRNPGDLPRGYDASKFGAYVFDVTARKQTSKDNKILEINNIINRGFKKIGPVNAN